MNFVPALLRKAIAFILLVALLMSTNLTFALSTPPSEVLDEEKVNNQTLVELSEENGISDNTNLKVTIDESLGLTTHKSLAIESISPGIIQNDLVEGRSLDENIEHIAIGTQEELIAKTFTTESVAVNREAGPIDFSNIDLSTAFTSTGDTKTLYEQENITIAIPDGDSGEEYTPPIPGNDVEYSDFVSGQSDGFLGQTQSATTTSTQNTYTCTVYEGYTCSYNLAAASIRQYNMSNPSVASVSVGSTSFTITGHSPGSSTLSVNYAGRTIATVYITVEKMLVPIGANYGTNTLEVGQATYLVIRSGNGGYTVTSSNPLVVFVSGNGTNWTLSGMNPGTAKITYRDSAGFFGTINMTVTAPPRNLSVSVGQTTLEEGINTSLTITDGNGGYTVTSSNPSVLSVSGNGTNWTLSAQSVGSSTVTVRDSRGKELTISYSVIDPSPLKTLRVSYNNAILRIGRTSSITILDGNGGYTVTSSNPSVLSVEGQGAYWIATARSGGLAFVTVKDQRGMTAKLSYEVRRKIEGTLSNTSLFFGRTETLTVTDGNGGYTVTSDNPAIATVRQTTQGVDTVYTVTPISVGQVSLTIRDSAGEEGWVRVTTRGDVKPLTLSTQNITVNAGSDAYFSITSGNGEYVHTMSNGNIEWNSADPSIPSYRVRGLSPGFTILQIADSAGRVAQVRVDVIAQPKVASITNLEFSSSIQDEGMGGIYFEVDGSYQEAGIEYHYGDMLQPIVEKLVLQDDHAYATLYSLECTDKTTCKVHLKPYTIDTNGNKIYHTNYDGTNYIVVGYDLSNSSLLSTLIDVESVSGGAETKNLNQTIARLRQIGVNVQKVAEEYKGIYNGGYDATKDQLTELQILLDPATYAYFAREMKKFANKIVNLDYSPQIAIQKLKQDFLELSTVLDSAYTYLSQLTSYQKQYYGSYLSVSSTLGFIGPGKLKGTKSLQKVASKVSEVVGVGVGKKLLGKYKNFECVPFRDEFRSLLRKEGVEYRDVKILANAESIYSDSAKHIFPNDLGVISTNSYHSATRVGDMVYDNVHPAGISIADFKKDLAIGQYNYYAIVEGLD